LSQPTVDLPNAHRCPADFRLFARPSNQPPNQFTCCPYAARQHNTSPVAPAKRLNEQRIRFAAALMPDQFTPNVGSSYSSLPAANPKLTANLSGEEKSEFHSLRVTI